MDILHEQPTTLFVPMLLTCVGWLYHYSTLVGQLNIFLPGK